jgi:hypothetical protein
LADEGDGDERDSIWSVARGAISLYFALFTSLFIAGIALLIWKGDPPTGDWASLALYIWQGSAPNALSSAAFSIIIIEVGRGLMVMAGWLEAKLRKRQERRMAEARDEGRHEARAESNAEWRAWLGRMREAQARGEPFDESPPYENAS